jgi:hypothetical protein
MIPVMAKKSRKAVPSRRNCRQAVCVPDACTAAVDQVVETAAVEQLHEPADEPPADESPSDCKVHWFLRLSAWIAGV